MARQFFPYFAPDPAAAPFPKPGFAQLASDWIGQEGSATDGWDAASAAVGGSVAGLSGLWANLYKCFNQLNSSISAGSSIPMQNLDEAIDLATRQLPPMVDKIAAACLGIGCDPAALAALPSSPPPPPVVITTVGCPGAAGSGGAPVGTISTVAITASANAVVEGLIAAHLIAGELATALTVAVPIVGAAIAVGLLLVHFLGHGCGSACIDAARAEQIYEAAADDVAAVYAHGMLTLKQTLAFLTYIWGAGSQHMNGFGTDQANRGELNMQKTITAEIVYVQKLAAPKPRALDRTAARAWYVSGPGWYPDALESGANLADTLLESLPNMKGV